MSCYKINEPTNHLLIESHIDGILRNITREVNLIQVLWERVPVGRVGGGRGWRGHIRPAQSSAPESVLTS